MPPNTLKMTKLRQCMPPMPAIKGTKVRINGKKRPRKIARWPHLSKKSSDFLMRSGVMALTLPEAMIFLPKKWPIIKLH